MSLFVKVSGIVIFLLMVISIQNANAGEIALKWAQIEKVTAKTDFKTKSVIVTASLVNKEKSADISLLYGGTFSPTVGTYLRPLKNHSINTFAQVQCMSPECSQLGVVIGIRNTPGNPYAYNEQRFIISRDNGI